MAITQAERAVSRSISWAYEYACVRLEGILQHNPDVTRKEITKALEKNHPEFLQHWLDWNEATK